MDTVLAVEQSTSLGIQTNNDETRLQNDSTGETDGLTVAISINCISLEIGTSEFEFTVNVDDDDGIGAVEAADGVAEGEVAVAVDGILVEDVFAAELATADGVFIGADDPFRPVLPDCLPAEPLLPVLVATSNIDLSFALPLAM
jgi:hypothetical protein